MNRLKSNFVTWILCVAISLITVNRIKMAEFLEDLAVIYLLFGYLLLLPLN